MKSQLLKPLLILTGLALSAGSVSAQTDSSATTTQKTTTMLDGDIKPFAPKGSFRTWSIGVNGGALYPAAFYGKNDFTNFNTKLGYGAFIKKQILPGFGLRLDFLRGDLSGDNTELLGNGSRSGNPVSSFETQIKYAGSLNAEVTLATINWRNKQTYMQPYLTAGAGLTEYNTTIVRNGGAATEYKPGGDGIRELFIPLGAGLKFNVSPGVNINLGYTVNLVDGDNIDGAVFANNLDRFSYGHAGLEFILGKKTKQPLATHNPVAAMQREYLGIKDDLMAQLAAEKEANAAARAKMEDELNKFKADADGDGVADFFDKCPNTAAGVKVDGSGCEIVTPKQDVKVIVTEDDRRIVRDAINNLLFDFGKATINAKSHSSLNRVAEILVSKNFSLKLAGHTDNVGSDASNLKLSKDRAEAIKAYLVSQGANTSRIEAVGYGESQPIASNKTAAGRTKNRRVEFTLY